MSLKGYRCGAMWAKPTLILLLTLAAFNAILLTNAYHDGLAVKMHHTGLGQHLDLLRSTHIFGYPKEDQHFGQRVQSHTGFDLARMLFIDDSEPILDAAIRFGIRYCLGASNPDSRMAQ